MLVSKRKDKTTTSQNGHLPHGQYLAAFLVMLGQLKLSSKHQMSKENVLRL